jgi:hypothetical protein
MTKEQELQHRLAMVADDLRVFRKFLDKQGFDLTKPTTHADMACTHLFNMEIALDLNDNECLNWKLYDSKKVAQIINDLKEIDVDGETMQYILKEVGMDEQMHRQLVMTKPIADTELLIQEKKSL